MTQSFQKRDCHREGNFRAAGVRLVRLGCLMIPLLATSGCFSVLPTSRQTPRTPWTSYAEAKSVFDKIVPRQTRIEDLKPLGLEPTSPNVRVLTYLDIIQRFLPNQSVTKEDLDRSVRECIEAREGSFALELDVSDKKEKREGNVFLDLLGFRRLTHETGWRFNALLLIRDDIVVYKLSSGMPQIDTRKKTVNPLGPLQEVDSLLFRSVPTMR